MLKPNRLCGSSLARKKTVKWELDRRFPARYTASKSPRRTSLPAAAGRASRGNVFPCAPEPAVRNGLPSRLRGKLMASLLAACRQYLAATLRLHACAEAVRLGASAFPRLKCALWQNNPPSLPTIFITRLQGRLFHPHRQRSPLAPSLAAFESLSVFDPRAHGQENRTGVAGSVSDCATHQAQQTGPDEVVHSPHDAPPFYFAPTRYCQVCCR
jgi:hypothetical protein